MWTTRKRYWLVGTMWSGGNEVGRKLGQGLRRWNEGCLVGNYKQFCVSWISRRPLFTIFIATHVFRLAAILLAANLSSKSAAVSMARTISSTTSLCGGGEPIERTEFPEASASGTSTLYAKRTPLFSARRRWRRGSVCSAVSPPTNYERFQDKTMFYFY
jgi:hypothetical protein